MTGKLIIELDKINRDIITLALKTVNTDMLLRHFNCRNDSPHHHEIEDNIRKLLHDIDY